jgi:hypothetical protein
MLVECVWDSPGKLVVIKVQVCQFRNMSNGKRNVSNKFVVRQVTAKPIKQTSEI